MTQKRIEDRLEALDQEFFGWKADIQKLLTIEESIATLAKIVERLSSQVNKQHRTSEDTQKLMIALMAEGKKL